MTNKCFSLLSTSKITITSITSSANFIERSPYVDCLSNNQPDWGSLQVDRRQKNADENVSEHGSHRSTKDLASQRNLDPISPISFILKVTKKLDCFLNWMKNGLAFHLFLPKGLVKLRPGTRGCCTWRPCRWPEVRNPWRWFLWSLFLVSPKFRRSREARKPIL